MSFGKRKAAVFLSLAVFGILNTAATANAATGVDGFQILNASTNGFAHKCTVIGSDNRNPQDQAVVCADIFTRPDGDYGDAAYGQIEAYCQQNSNVGTTVVRCAQINIAGNESVFANALRGREWISTHRCGHQYISCPTGRLEIPTGYYSYDSNTPGCSSYPNSENDVWMIAQGGTSTHDTSSPVAIELPNSDQWTYLGTGNTNDGTGLSTGHYYICD